MIRYLIVLILAVSTVLLIDSNPLWVLPLLLVVASFLWEKRWPGAIGIACYALITLSRAGDIGLTDIPSLLLSVLFILLPMLFMLELVLSPSPYRMERISLFPLLLVLGLSITFLVSLTVLSRVQRIGVYLNSDPTLQVFMVMSLTLLLVGPLLLGARSGGKTSKATHKYDNDKNE